MQQEIQSALSNPPVVKAVLSSNALNVLLATLEVYSVVASAIILTISGAVTYYMMRKLRAEARLTELKINQEEDKDD